MIKKSTNLSNITMIRYIHTQTRKAVTATAGVQSIIESPVGAFKVMNINHWLYFQEKIPNNYSSTDDNGNFIFEIKEPRLLNRLKSTGIFENIQRLIKVPPNSQNEDNRIKPAKDKQVGRVEYFPTWFFCESCERFKPISEWWSGWEDLLRNTEGIKDSNKIRDKFIYDMKLSGRPNCYHCYKKQLEGKIKRKYHKLEQVRFVFVSPDGDIKDIDWEKWITAQRISANDLDEDNEGIQVGKYSLGKNTCCDTPSLYYIRSTKLSDLAGITIQCENCGKKKTLAGFFNLRSKKGTINDKKKNVFHIYYKPLIRTSNSIYYPIVMNSLYIPQPENKLSNSDISTIRTMNLKGITPEVISSMLKYNLNDVKRILGESINISEIEFRKNEYNYLLNEYDYLLNSDSNNAMEQDLIIEDSHLDNELIGRGIERILKIKRLKLTSVQTGYTRLFPMDRDSFSNSDDRMVRFDGSEIPLKARFTVDNPNETEYLMGVENFGEGIFIKWNDTFLNNYISAYLKTERGLKDINSLFDRLKENEMFNKNKFSDIRHLTKFLFIHSFSHMIIKEMEFLCGYSSSSVSERIYCDSDTMNGLLIYTIAGSEGSFGGLIKQANSINFLRILESGLLRARDCSSDPICYESEGQGIGGLNYAACFSCLLISETSCEEFNSFLDRRLLLFNHD